MLYLIIYPFLQGASFTDNTVTDGHVYEYRAIAHNVAGSSEPGPASKPIAAKPMKGEFL